MSLVTVQRTPSPCNSPELTTVTSFPNVDNVSGSVHVYSRQKRSSKSALKKLRKLVNSVRFISKLRFSESYFTIKGAALILPQGECIRNVTKASCMTGGDIQNHLQSMFYMLRAEDTIKVAVKLESAHANRVRYMAVVSCIGTSENEESCILGFDCNEVVTIGLVLPLWADTSVRLDGDGGFFVRSNMRQHIFKPLSVQAMWSVLQSLHTCCEISHREYYHPGGSSHAWITYYTSRVNSEQGMLNEWNMMEDLWSVRQELEGTASEIELKKLISKHLRQVMMEVDLDEVSGKFLRTTVEERMGMSLKDYRGFVDQESLIILGQMDSASEIFSYLYLGTEWNAGNLEELRKNGITHILNCTREIDNFFPGMFEYMNIREFDEEETDLLKYWDKSYRFIHKARMAGGHVFVHCKMGISRSASTVIAFVMKEYGSSLEETIKYVAERRPIIRPNSGFMEQLETYKGILDASGQRHNALWKPMYRSKSDTNLASKCIELTDLEEDCRNAAADEDEKSETEAEEFEPMFESQTLSSDGEDEDHLDSPSNQEDDLCPQNKMKSKTTDLTSKHACLLDSSSRFKSFSTPHPSPQKLGLTRRVSSLPELHQLDNDDDDDDDFQEMNRMPSTWTTKKLTSHERLKTDDYWIKAEEEDPHDPEVIQERLRKRSFDGAPSFGVDLQMEFSNTLPVVERNRTEPTYAKHVDINKAFDSMDFSASPVDVKKQQQRRLVRASNFDVAETLEVHSGARKRRIGVVSHGDDASDVIDDEANVNANALTENFEVPQLGGDHIRKESKPEPGFVQRTLEEIEERNRKNLTVEMTALSLTKDDLYAKGESPPRASVQRSQSLKEKRLSEEIILEAPANVFPLSKSEESVPSISCMDSEEMASQSIKKLKTSEIESGLSSVSSNEERKTRLDDTWADTIATKFKDETSSLELGKVKQRLLGYENYTKQTDLLNQENESPSSSLAPLESRMNAETLHLIREIGSRLLGNLETSEDLVEPTDSMPKCGLVKRITMAIEKREENVKKIDDFCTYEPPSSPDYIICLDSEDVNENKVKKDDFECTEPESQLDNCDDEIQLLEQSRAVSKRLSQFEDSLMLEKEKKRFASESEPEEMLEDDCASIEKPSEISDHILNKQGYVSKRRSLFEENSVSEVAKALCDKEVSENEVFDHASCLNQEPALCAGKGNNGNHIVSEDTTPCSSSESDISVKNLVGKFESKPRPRSEIYQSFIPDLSFLHRPLTIEITDKVKGSSVQRTQSLKAQKSPSPPCEDVLSPLLRERSSSWSEKSRNSKGYDQSALDKRSVPALGGVESVKERQHHGKTHPLTKLAARKSAEQLGNKNFYMQ